MKQEIELKVTGMGYNPKLKGTYSLILANATNEAKRFSILIGEAEAQSIALKIHNKHAPRPLTHDLIVNLLYEFNVSLEKVVIYKMKNDVFYSKLYIKNATNKFILIDARTSDAIALAIRVNVRIFIEVDVWDKIEEKLLQKEIDYSNTNFEEKIDLEGVEKNLITMTKSHLEKVLKVAIETENYELAVQIRDEIKKRN